MTDSTKDDSDFLQLLTACQYEQLDEKISKVLARDVQNVSAWYFRAESQKMQMRYAAALAAAMKVLQLLPEHLAAKIILVQSAAQLGLVDFAEQRVAGFEFANLSSQQSWYAIFYRELALYDQALTSIENVIRAFPDDPYPVQLKGTIEMCMGRFDEGLHHYQNYVSVDFYKRHRPDVVAAGWDLSRYWSGEDLTGKTVLVVPHGGVGDMIQFVRYIPCLKQLGAKKVYVHLPTTRIAKLIGSHPDLQVAQELTSDQYDVFSDPYGLWLNLQSRFGFLRQDRYLVPVDSEFSTEMTQHIRARANGKRLLGLSWCSDMPDGAPRTLPLAQIMPLFALSDIHWVIFQRGWALKEFEHSPFAAACSIVPEQASFDDTAALVKQLECVVTIESFLTHLAGAIGTPVFLMGSMALDWRHGNADGISPWYPHTTIIRQSTLGDWASVITQLRSLLDLGASNSSGPAKIPRLVHAQTGTRRTLYLDCSGFEEEGSDEEQHEVIEHLIRHAAALETNTLSVRLVHCKHPAVPYSENSRLSQRLLHCGRIGTSDPSVHPQAGDMVLITSGDPVTCMERADYYRLLQNKGVAVLALLHDLAPLYQGETNYAPDYVTRFHSYCRFLFSLQGVLCLSQTTAQAVVDLAKGNQVNLCNNYRSVWSHPGVLPVSAPLQRLPAPVKKFITTGNITDPAGRLDSLLTVLQILWDKGLQVELEILCSPAWINSAAGKSVRQHGMYGHSIQLRFGAFQQGILDANSVQSCYIEIQEHAGYKLALSQATYIGMPVVLSDTPIHREFAPAGAVYFPYGDTRALQTAMEGMLEPQESCSRAKDLNPSERAWSACAKNILRLLLES